MLVLIVLLVIFGLAVLFSSSEYNGRVRFGDSACYFKKQLFATALGMGVMYMVSSIDYHFFLRLGPVAYLISMFLSGAVLFVGQEINGSKRWLNLGPLSFQPSEFAKVAVILFLAWQIERTKKATRGFGFMCRTILTLLPIIGLVGSNNLSTAIIILGIGGILIFVSNPGYLEFIGLGSAGTGFIAVFLALHRRRRRTFGGCPLYRASAGKAPYPEGLSAGTNQCLGQPGAVCTFRRLSGAPGSVRDRFRRSVWKGTGRESPEARFRAGGAE